MYTDTKYEIKRRNSKKYSNANLFILPSKSEGLGRVVIEAQARACPVLVSSNTGAVDLIIDNETGYIFENNNLNEVCFYIYQYLIYLILKE